MFFAADIGEEKMNRNLLLVISMAACLAATLLRKVLAAKYEDGGFARQMYNAITSVTAAALLLALADFSGVSRFTVLLGLSFGLVTALQQITMMQAVQTGSLSYTTVITSLSMLIPSLSGAIFWGETLSAVQIAGIVLMVGCLVLSVEVGGEAKKTSLQWLIYCGIAFICTGMIGVMQKWHQNSVYKDEGDIFLVIAFGVSFLFSAVGLIISTRVSWAARSTARNKKSILGWTPMVLMAVSGLCIAANNKLNLYLSGVFDSAVFFPIVNGGGLILTLLAAFIFFKEKLTRRQWIGLSCGVLATICLCDPFG